jgi:hypothetical protein
MKKASPPVMDLSTHDRVVERVPPWYKDLESIDKSSDRRVRPTQPAGCGRVDCLRSPTASRRGARGHDGATSAMAASSAFEKFCVASDLHLARPAERTIRVADERRVHRAHSRNAPLIFHPGITSGSHFGRPSPKRMCQKIMYLNGAVERFRQAGSWPAA